MSVKVMTWVWDHSRAKGSQHHVLLAIADCASDDGANAYPSMSELMRKTRLSERSVQRAIEALVKLGELFVGRNTGPRGCNRYRVIMTTPQNDTPVNLTPRQFDTPRQDDTPRQFDPPQNDTPRQIGTPQNDTPPSICRADPVKLTPGTVLEPSKRKNSPSESSSRRKLIEPERADVEQVCRHLADRIEANGSRRPPITKGWRDAARRLIDLDGRTVEQVIKAIDWCQDDDFWRSNVMSMPKLREKYDQLRLAAQRGRQPGNQLAVPGASPPPRPSTSARKDAEMARAMEELRAMRGNHGTG